MVLLCIEAVEQQMKYLLELDEGNALDTELVAAQSSWIVGVEWPTNPFAAVK